MNYADPFFHVFANLESDDYHNAIANSAQSVIKVMGPISSSRLVPRIQKNVQNGELNECINANWTLSGLLLKRFTEITQQLL